MPAPIMALLEGLSINVASGFSMSHSSSLRVPDNSSSAGEGKPFYGFDVILGADIK
jgi:hypothetical protein